MDEYNQNNGTPRRAVNSTLLVVGIGLVILGCLTALDTLTPTYFLRKYSILRFWPLIVVALGVVKTIEGKFRGFGGWMITITGIILFASTVQGRSVAHLIGPATLIAVGIFIVLHAQKKQRKVPIELQKSGGFARGTAILSGYKYRPSGGNFDGGEVTAIFGGFELDLRQCTMNYETARIDVFCMMGGGEIRVPEGWDVSIHAQAVAGSVDDKTIALPVAEAKRPRLLITGSVLLGGVEVK
ncbi:MAG: cell wall-active antibiotics response protein [Holophagaceae bacterium]|nr:cell wall-active antibiotics response protein [Holophagaceae bacterium]